MRRLDAVSAVAGSDTFETHCLLEKKVREAETVFFGKPLEMGKQELPFIAFQHVI